MFTEVELTEKRGGLTAEEYRWKMISEGSSQVTERCSQCGQQLIEVDNRGERLVGCLTCNLWAAEGKQHWIRLSEEDLRALHQLRHG